ncbi:hypothetical protein K470DRAFT_215140 [Piedraia hortae CBS 480.64]|uniref:Uncharacterized protein n=1 Tax=Piedraia hortae CBS 480.64 TaxID=1314780 RepID=A0A6A7C263_9PEZI|nr:hypothetical protein K470DRAFT_215140 [Piedraia hortae CBS 480.64]
MPAKRIDGTSIASSIRQRLNTKIATKQASNPAYKPNLVIIQVGDRSDSSTYIRMKFKAASEAGIACNLQTYPSSVPESELVRSIEAFNRDPSIHGILVQLPLPEHVDEDRVTAAVAQEKDVDGFGSANFGEVAKKGGRPLFVPCTPKGVMTLLEESEVEIAGKHAVVLGRSNIVGAPVSFLLGNADATVTVCHSKTKGVRELARMGDILISAVGEAGLVKGDWIKPGAVVIDVGTNFVPDESKKSGQRLVGDVEFGEAMEVASLITPVPGGVGPMTVAMLLQNVVDAADRQHAG